MKTLPSVYKSTRYTAIFSAALISIAGLLIRNFSTTHGSASEFRRPSSETVELASFENVRIVAKQPPAHGEISLFHTRAEKLAEWIRKSVFTKVPVEQRQILEGRKFVIAIDSELPTDGLFEDPGELTDTDEIQVSVHRSHFMGPNADQLMAHELFHAFHFLLHPGDEPWLREGLAQLFEFRTLGRLNGKNVRLSFEKPSTPLQGDYSPANRRPETYGHALLYFYYLWRNCGGDELMWKITTAPVNGTQAVDYGLSHVHQTQIVPLPCANFSQSASFFEVARFRNRSISALAYPDAYLLMSTTYAAQPVTTPLTSTAYLTGLAPFQPFFARGGARVPAAWVPAENGWLTYWIETSFPYAVSPGPTQPVTGTEWDQIVFKTR